MCVNIFRARILLQRGKCTVCWWEQLITTVTNSIFLNIGYIKNRSFVMRFVVFFTLWATAHNDNYGNCTNYRNSADYEFGGPAFALPQELKQWPLSALISCKNLMHSFIPSGHFYSAPSSPLPLRGAPDYSADTVSEFHAEVHRQL